ncbi:hypothetical protein J4P41_15390 [Gluconobacter sp. NFX36]|uniref:hypothetical protein n=1 Tax=Gluconobacter TaxID=441 RepID=UPI003CEE8966
MSKRQVTRIEPFSTLAHGVPHADDRCVLSNREVSSIDWCAGKSRYLCWMVQVVCCLHPALSIKA